MRQNDAGRALAHGLTHDFAGVYWTGVKQASAAFDRRADDLVFRVEQLCRVPDYAELRFNGAETPCFADRQLGIIRGL